MPNLIVVVDPNYGDLLETEIQRAPVWVISTESNNAACVRLWKKPNAGHSVHEELTSYTAENPENRLTNFLGILQQLQTHHGEWDDEEASFSAGFVLEVIGLDLSDDAVRGLREFGFTSFAATPKGFQTIQSPTTEP